MQPTINQLEEWLESDTPIGEIYEEWYGGINEDESETTGNQQSGEEEG